MSYATLFPLNLLITLGCTVLAGFFSSILIGLGVSGEGSRANPFETFGALLAFGYPLLAVLIVGGVLYLLLLPIACPGGQRLLAAALSPVAAVPLFLVAILAATPDPNFWVFPVSFSVLLAVLVRLPVRTADNSERSSEAIK